MLYSIAKKIVKTHLPENAWKKLVRLKSLIRYLAHKRSNQQLSDQALLKLKKDRHKISVLFFVLHESVWKYDRLYFLLQSSEYFKPYVVICPYLHAEDVNMKKDMKRAFNHFHDNGYSVLSSFDEEKKEWIDFKTKFSNTIVFFTNPHNITHPFYYINHWLDCLTFYVPYSFHVTHLNEMQFNQYFHNFVWKVFYETPYHFETAKKVAFNKGENVIVTGYPGNDSFLFFEPSKSPWKENEKTLKRIIWAPHHTIFENDTDLGLSTFLLYHDYFFELLSKYENSIQICFKPHPILKTKLNKLWGEEKTVSYYKKWSSIPNGQINDSDYIDLFLTSDALIHDCASFMVEYLCVNKPSLFLVRDENVRSRFNEFGKSVFDTHYKAETKNEIEAFVLDIINGSNDPKKVVRDKILHESIMVGDRKPSSEKIFEFLICELGK